MGVKMTDRLKLMTRIFSFTSLFLTIVGINSPRWYWTIALLFTASSVGYLQAYQMYGVPVKEKKKNVKANKKV